MWNKQQENKLKQTLYQQSTAEYFIHEVNPPIKCDFCDKVIMRDLVASEPYIYRKFSYSTLPDKWVCEDCVNRLKNKNKWRFIEDYDWRLNGQEIYLANETLKFMSWKPQSDVQDHDHCAFCWKKFYTEILDDHCVVEGYVAIVDEYDYWICKECFNDFKEKFEWKL